MQPTKVLSVFDHFACLVPKGLRYHLYNNINLSFQFHVKNFLTIEISKTPAETFRKPPLLLRLVKLSSVEESDESFLANKILWCLMFQSQQCSVNFLKRQFRELPNTQKNATAVLTGYTPKLSP